MELETINKLFLELSQIATAKTQKELKLEKELEEARSGQIVEARAKELYGPGRVDSVCVANLLEWLRNNKPETFQRDFGTKGMEMLDRAISANKELKGKP